MIASGDLSPNFLTPNLLLLRSILNHVILPKHTLDHVTPFFNIFYINPVRQMIRPKLHQVSPLHSFTLSLFHAISHCMYSVLINPIYQIICHRDGLLHITTMLVFQSSCSFPTAPFHPFQNFYLTILQISLYCTVNLMRPGTHFYFFLTTLLPASGHSGGQGPCFIYLFIPGAQPRMQ